MFMYCEKCGNNIPENLKFCPRCGKKTEEVVMPVNRSVNYSGADIRVNHSVGRMIGGVIICLLCVAMMVVLSILVLNIDVWKENERMSEKESLNNLKTWFIIFIVHFFVLYILNLIKLRAVSNTELFLSKEGIYGTGGTPNYFGNISFCCKYQEIMSVIVKGSVICIFTSSGSFKLLLEESEQAACEILQRVEWAKANNRTN